MRSREGDLKEFFAHEIQSFPPSLSDLGKLHLPNTKSDLLNCIGQPGLSDPPSTYECTVLDGGAIVHFLPTNLVNTFDEYADQVFIPYLSKQLQDSMRVEGHIPSKQFKRVYQGEERQGCAKKGIWSS